MDRTTLFAEVLLPLPVPGTFTYRIPFAMNQIVHKGQRVSVQFGSRKVYAGLILELHEKAPATGIPKYILSVLDEKPLVNNLQIEFWKWISDYYMSTLGEVMNVAVPSAFKLSSESKIILSETFKPDSESLTDSEYLITEALMQQKRLTIKEVGQIVGYEKVLPLLKSMIQKQMIFMEEELNSSYKPKLEKYLLFADAYHEESALHELLDQLGRRAPKQLEILMAMMTLVGLPLKKGVLVKKSDLQQKLGGNLTALKALVDKGVLIEEEKPASRFNEEDTANGDIIVFSEEQKRAFDELQKEMQEHRVILLHGVTSSGKTEIYIKLIEDALKKGKQVLYLLPEIALTTQIIRRLRIHFGDEIGVYHSRYNQNERAEVWENVAGLQGEDVHKPYRIILGPRSAMFLPFENLGLIIVDEEHDQSYKQFDPAPRYNARDASIYLAGLHDAKVVLGSATPAIETYYNAQSGKYGLVSLTERYGGIEMPRILVVDMKEEKRRRMLRSHFSSVLLKHIEGALEQKQQAILFQNRRGFSLRIECEECNWVPQCKNCDVTMTYHKKQELLRCHYCGYSRPVPPVCEHCGSPHLTMEGFGTEKVEEELSIILPNARIDRMDLDTTRSKNSFQRIFSDFENGKTDILTGTQMVTKGLDFDNVQVVGILSADNMLRFPDFRAHERSFQLMEQVSGRAGRKNKQGTVVIQSWEPSHLVIKDVVRHDFLSMFRRELDERQKFHYPPFYRLIIIKLRHKDPVILNNAADILAKDMRVRFGKLVYGPEYPMVPRIKNLYIKQIMLKVPRGAQQNIQKEELRQVLSDFNRHTHLKSVQIQLDVDPQ
ncbi:MAG: primosomal protein N' [Bacteroidales bacterium]|nr:primosomal protein N' [Bacteroidales bacterium]